MVAPSLEMVAFPGKHKGPPPFGEDEFVLRVDKSILALLSFLTSAIHHQLVHAPGTQGGPDSLCNHLKKREKPPAYFIRQAHHIEKARPIRKQGSFSNLAGIDVANELGNALRRVCSLLQQDNRCGLETERGRRQERKGLLMEIINSLVT